VAPAASATRGNNALHGAGADAELTPNLEIARSPSCELLDTFLNLAGEHGQPAAVGGVADRAGPPTVSSRARGEFYGVVQLMGRIKYSPAHGANAPFADGGISAAPATQ
jgi:hypothetical protein